MLHFTIAFILPPSHPCLDVFPPEFVESVEVDIQREFLVGVDAEEFGAGNEWYHFYETLAGTTFRVQPPPWDI